MSFATLTNAEEELLSTWFSECKENPRNYVEPVLNSSTVDVIKQCCDMLKQDSHVFVMTVDILTKYIMVMNEKNVEIENQLLTILSVICIGSKYVGELSELKFTPVATLYKNMTNRRIEKSKFKRMEMKILVDLDGSFPICFVIDDVKALAQVYMNKLNLIVDLNRLCIEILDVVYIYYRRLFNRLRNFYGVNPTAAEAFKELIKHRLYIPCGVFLSAFKLTKLKNVICLDTLINGLCDLVEIHRNHLELLTTYILEIFD
ncbi:uncharacterized protein [Onthophagus taurus]|uniref:uncharacterized protein n=1 Tax=Onthophagus taurus TaxID=166361 RepID=UPI000C209D67|nr:uncharacterized protein LOC111416479 [Onthophagus taurus]